MAANNGSPFWTGNITEVAIWPIALTGTQQTNLCHNQRLYWGTGSGTC
jgi:hypothetical protein